VLCFFVRFSISGIAFCKRGVLSPCLQKQYFLSLAMLSPSKLLFILLSVLLFLYFSSLGPPPSSPSLLPAIGKKIRSEKGIFFFCSEFFFLSHKHKESKEYGHRKGR